VHQRHRGQTTDRQTTDGRPIAYSEHERKFTSAKNWLLFLYIYLHYTQRIYTKFPRTRPITSLARPHLPYFFLLHPHAWSSGQSTRGVAEVGRKPCLTSWMASSQTDAISVHFPLHFILPHTCPHYSRELGS